MLRSLVVVALILGFTQTAHAQGSQLPEADVERPASQAVEEQPWKPNRFHFFHVTGLALRINPLGAFASTAFMARYRLYESDSPALRDNFIGAGPVVFFSPAFIRAGLGVEVQPLSILQLSASYEFIGFFKTFEYNQSFPDPTDNTSDAELKRLAAAKQNYATYGGILTLAAMFQFKLGPIAVRSNFRAFDYMMTLRAGDKVWYDSILDVMSPGHGWVLSDDTDLLYVTNFGLAAGLRYTYTHSLFTAQEVPATAGADAYTLNSPIHRIGPFIAYTFFDDPRRKANAPTLVLVSQWFLRHRYRTGEAVSQAIPWFALAFQFKGII